MTNNLARVYFIILCNGFARLRHLQTLLLFLLCIIIKTGPVKADINVSYSIGDMLFASYDLPKDLPDTSVRLASIEEYTSLAADIPNFYEKINIIDRSSTVDELFLSTSSTVQDQKFDLVFVMSENAKVVDWYNVEVVSEGLKITDALFSQGASRTEAQQPKTPPIAYNAGNREVVALLSEVSRQLSKTRNSTNTDTAVNEPTLTIAPQQPVLLSSAPPTNDVNVQEALPVEVGDLNVRSADEPTIQPGSATIISEVRLATASMKNFVLTLLTAGLALAMATALVIFKTRESIAAGLQPKTVTPPVPVVANEQSPASENFLNYLKDENQRSQETYLKSMEMLVLGVGMRSENKQPEVIQQPIADVPTETGVGEQKIGSTASANAAVPVNAQPQTRVQKAENPKRDQVVKNINRATASNQSLTGTLPGAETVSAQVQEQLNLAEVYKNMGDIFVAQNLLQEIIKTGNPAEVARARDAIEKIGDV